jgi:hypothetical protein
MQIIVETAMYPAIGEVLNVPKDLESEVYHLCHYLVNLPVIYNKCRLIQILNRFARYVIGDVFGLLQPS